MSTDPDFFASAVPWSDPMDQRPVASRFLDVIQESKRRAIDGKSIKKTRAEGFRIFKTLSPIDRLRLFHVHGKGWILNDSPFESSEWHQCFSKMEAQEA